MINLDMSFFDQIQKEYPKACDHFFNWLFKYKIRIGWNELFMGDLSFNDLPYEMQVGIISTYEREFFFKNIQVEALKRNDIQDIKNIFKDAEKIIIDELKNG